MWSPPEALGGAGLRVAVIDSGVAPGHPHVGALACGISLVGDDRADTVDRLGHGTAVAAAIREKLPEATLVPVRVLDRTLATSARMLADAIVWAVEDGARLVNLSLGTRNAVHVPIFEAALSAALVRGALVVSAYDDGEVQWYPGSLAGVLGVVVDPSCPRFSLAVSASADGPVGASPWPRPIPGVAAERNLSGVSFAVANATGLIGRLLGARPELRTADEIRQVASGSTR